MRLEKVYISIWQYGKRQPVLTKREIQRSPYPALRPITVPVPVPELASNHIYILDIETEAETPNAPSLEFMMLVP